MNKLTYPILALVFAMSCGTAFANRQLDKKDAEKLEVRHSMIGFRNTLLFYTYGEQRAVLRILIDNKDETFPVTGTVHLFEKSATVEELKKWLNNQHSDGLFPEIPEPIFTKELPKGTCDVISFKQTGTSKNPGPQGEVVFKDYEVELVVKEFKVDEQFTLSAFTDTARVHVKSK